MGIVIRDASTSDIDWLLTELKAFSNFFSAKIELFKDSDFARNFVSTMVANHLVLIADRQGERMGFISGYVTPHPYNPEIKTLAETFWWVSPRYRSSRAGLMLLNAFTAWGKANADWITFALENHSPINEKTLTKRGYHLTERSFLLEVS